LQAPVVTGVQHLGKQAQQMLQHSLDAFARMDVETAVKVAREDDKVDVEYSGLIRQLITYMIEDPRSIPAALDIMWAARSLERIGDRSRNICEYVVYFVKGKDIRHVNLDKVKQEIGLADDNPDSDPEKTQ
jgi:phosphate transport system protein